MSNNKIDENILKIKRDSLNRLKESSNNLIKSNKDISNPFNNQSKERILNKGTQTLLEEIECYEESVQTNIRKEKDSQTDFKEILQIEDKKYDEKKLQYFLEKSLLLVEEALNNREEDAFECNIKIKDILITFS